MDKPYKIEIEDGGDYLYVVVGGEKLTAEISAAYWEEIAQRCKELEKTKILIEKDFPETVSPAEMIRMGLRLGELLPGKKIAFLDRYGHDEVNELGKKLARSQHVVLQVFKTVEDARRWLMAN
jgi:hypothetical protein